ncbi:hypothetical protein SAMN02927937_01874 [Paenimyroides aquimaris]|uniref:Lipocalin-like domain-containing protein n=1 Tax=Paenimyroides marinum TaxID=1159016 RepID=A0A1H6LM29_9FLAO|nr:hypothetical protein [Paenimyroides aquimaris]SEH87188.1 hypothetical protein SAMN02927937_01874 [Paenimyroides aquimaris]
MKNIIYLLGLSLILSCGILKKDSNSYNGTWILQSKSGGFAGMTKKPEKETKIVIKKEKMFSYEDGTLIAESAFKVEKGKVIQSTEPQDIIVGNKLMKQSIAVSGDTLIIADQCYDCFTYFYLRKK